MIAYVHRSLACCIAVPLELHANKSNAVPARPGARQGYCYEGIRQVSEKELADGGQDVDIAAVAQQQLLDKVTYERWCPHTGAGVSSF